MAFTSAAFLGLTALAVVLYYVLPKRAQWCVLLAASMVFYLAGGWKSLIWLLLVILVTWTAGHLLGRLNERAPSDKAEKAKLQKQKKFISVCCIILCFGLLFTMKYWNFTRDLFPESLASRIPTWDFLVPLGLSFFIFQSISYVIDVYRGKQKCENNFLKYALFVSFFPQMVQGPISRYGQLAPQLTTERSLCWADIQAGIQLALWGYFKKLVIADRAAVLVNNVIFDNTPYGGAVIATGIFFYCIQLYCDFSGGIDITRGVARMFGIDLVQNFRRPLFATSLTDYWRRWHITLGSWMRDYVFYPLSLSKPFGKLGKWARKHLKGTPGKIFATSAATFIVYLIIGIWHGANFRYIAFGLWNGTLITASLLMERRFLAWKSALHIDDKSTGWRIFMTVRTALLVFIGRYFTRAPRLTTVFSLLKTTVLHPNFGELPHKILSLGLTAGDLLIVAAGILIVHAVEFFEERGTDVRGWLNTRNPNVQRLILLGSMLILILFGIFRSGYISSEFIYGQF